MSTALPTVSDSEQYKVYEIRYRITGPVKADQPAEPGMHYRASFSVVFKGVEVEGSLLHLTENFADPAAAKSGARARAIHLIDQHH